MKAIPWIPKDSCSLDQDSSDMDLPNAPNRLWVMRSHFGTCFGGGFVICYLPIKGIKRVIITSISPLFRTYNHEHLSFV